MAEGDTLLNAIFGAIVSVVLTFVPFSPLVGGIVAGYLEGGSRDDGIRVGAISGVIALVPLLGVLLLVAGFFGLVLLGGVPPAVGVIGVVVVVFVLVTVGIYTIGLSALGGWLGNYVRTDTDVAR